MAAKRKAKAKPLRGRPPSADPRMGSPILVRVSPTERAALQAAADAAGKPLSSWVRDRALGGAVDDQIRGGDRCHV